MAEREGFEPSVPLLTAHTISSRAPSASSDISPKILGQVSVFLMLFYGGEGGIRTHDPAFGRIPLFESGAFSRSATSPSRSSAEIPVGSIYFFDTSCQRSYFIWNEITTGFLGTGSMGGIVKNKKYSVMSNGRYGGKKVEEILFIDRSILSLEQDVSL